MSRNAQATPSPWPPAPTATDSDAATLSQSAAREDAVALLRLAGLDAELGRLSRLVPAILEPLECQRSELAALAELIEKDRPQGTRQQRGEIQEARQRRLLRNQRMHAELAKALKRDEADALAMSCELQRKTADLAEQGDAALARVSAPLRLRYRAAVQKGQQPALVAVHDGRCPGCGEALPDATRRLVQESLRVVPCSGCLRLLYDRNWTARDLMPSTLRPVPRAGP